VTDTVQIESDLPALAKEWDDLAARLRAIPFLYAGCISAWWSAFGSGDLELLTVRREGRLVGVVPLQRRSARLRSPTNSESSDFGLLAEDGEARAALADAVLGRGGRSLELERLDAEGDDVPALRAAAGAHRYRLLERVVERAPYLQLEGDFETYFRSRSKNLTGSLRRRRRRLGEEGAVEVEVADGQERRAELLREGYALEDSGWKQDTAIASREDARRFYDGLADWAAQRGILRLAFLRVDGRAVAFQLALEDDGVFYYCKAGYDSAYNRFSPGTLLFAALLERAFEQGLRRAEFLGADEPWKLEWTDTVRELECFEAFSPSLAGVAGWAAERWGRPAARRLGAGRVRGLLRR
jgi:CelD/BcsL family acetyltransferase involved in cellulose biosynthesis